MRPGGKLSAREKNPLLSLIGQSKDLDFLQNHVQKGKLAQFASVWDINNIRVVPQNTKVQKAAIPHE
jgi:hypothetical protein